MTIEIHGLSGLGEIVANDPLADMLAAGLLPFAPQSGDILVVTQKIVSKAEGRAIPLASVTPREEARRIAQDMGKDPRMIELVLAESTEIVRAVRGVLITRHRLGFVMANAGIDASNVGPDTGDIAILLPLDPDASARAIAQTMHLQYGVQIGIIISDSFGRPFRHGVTNVAVGAAGLPALYDLRGQPDRNGRAMQSTLIAYGDLIASAAGLVMGEGAQGVPAALVRGLELPDGNADASALVRSLDEDMFR